MESELNIVRVTNKEKELIDNALVTRNNNIIQEQVNSLTKIGKSINQLSTTSVDNDTREKQLKDFSININKAMEAFSKSAKLTISPHAKTDSSILEEVNEFNNREKEINTKVLEALKTLKNANSYKGTISDIINLGGKCLINMPTKAIEEMIERSSILPHVLAQDENREKFIKLIQSNISDKQKIINLNMFMLQATSRIKKQLKDNEEDSLSEVEQKILKGSHVLMNEFMEILYLITISAMQYYYSHMAMSCIADLYVQNAKYNKLINNLLGKQDNKSKALIIEDKGKSLFNIRVEMFLKTLFSDVLNIKKHLFDINNRINSLTNSKCLKNEVWTEFGINLFLKSLLGVIACATVYSLSMFPLTSLCMRVLENKENKGTFAAKFASCVYTTAKIGLTSVATVVGEGYTTNAISISPVGGTIVTSFIAIISIFSIYKRICNIEDKIQENRKTKDRTQNINDIRALKPEALKDFVTDGAIQQLVQDFIQEAKSIQTRAAYIISNMKQKSKEMEDSIKELLETIVDNTDANDFSIITKLLKRDLRSSFTLMIGTQETLINEERQREMGKLQDLYKQTEEKATNLNYLVQQKDETITQQNQKLEALLLELQLYITKQMDTINQEYKTNMQEQQQKCAEITQVITQLQGQYETAKKELAEGQELDKDRELTYYENKSKEQEKLNKAYENNAQICQNMITKYNDIIAVLGEKLAKTEATSSTKTS